MATFKTRKATGGARAANAAKTAVGDVQDTFVLVDNGDNTCTVLGVTKAGNEVAIDAVAKLAATSSAPTILTVDAPVGMTFAMHAAGPLGHSDVTATVTWNDGSIGPFDGVLPVDVVSGGPTGIKIVPGTITTH